MSTTPEPTCGVPETSDLGVHTLSDGTRVRFRFARIADAAAVRDAMATASIDTLRNRFFAAVRGLGDLELREALEPDPLVGRCLVGEWESAGRSLLVCGVRYIRVGQSDEAELALTVHDRFQRQGLGRVLLQLGERLALADGIKSFRAHVLPSNEAMLALLARIAPSASKVWEDDIICVRFGIPLAEAPKG